MTNTTFRKRALLSSVAMLLVAFIALGSATFAWFTSSKTANATGLSFTTTAASGIVVASQSAKTLAGEGNAFSKTTILNKQSGGSTGGAINFDPASYMEVNSTSKTATMVTTKSADPDDADAYATTPEAITTVNYSGATTGAYTTGIFAEKVYLKATGAATAVSVSNVSITQAQGSTQNTVFNAVTALVVDDEGKVVWHANNAGTIPSSHITGTTGGYTSSNRGSLTAITDHAITGTIDSTGSRYVWVIVYLDGENDAVYTTGVAADTLVSAVDVQFTMP